MFISAFVSRESQLSAASAGGKTDELRTEETWWVMPVDTSTLRNKHFVARFLSSWLLAWNPSRSTVVNRSFKGNSLSVITQAIWLVTDTAAGKIDISKHRLWSPWSVYILEEKRKKKYALFETCYCSVAITTTCSPTYFFLEETRGGVQLSQCWSNLITWEMGLIGKWHCCTRKFLIKVCIPWHYIDARP